MVNIIPQNSLEQSLLAAKEGAMPMNKFIAMLLASELAVPSAKEMQNDGTGLVPLFLEKGGVGMLAAFTDKTLIAQFTSAAHYCLVMNAFDLLKMMPREYGIVINPGCNIGFDISPNGIAEILSDFANNRE